MAWNEPDDRRKDPWKDKNDDRPPDLDEAFRKLRNILSGGAGGGKSSGGGGGNSGARIFSPKVLLAAVAAVLGIYFATGFYQLDQQERGVVMRFGAVLEELQMPGLRWNWPIIDNVTKVNVTRIENVTNQSLMLTEDENIVDIRMSVQYLVAKPKDFVIEVRDPRQSLAHAAESAMRHVVGSSSMDNVLTEGREQVAIEVQQRLQRYLDLYSTGILVVKVNIDNSQPPAQVADAFDDVQKAQEDNQRLINEANAYKESIVPEARGEAQKQIEEAKAYREQVIARADGEAQRFSQLLAEYHKAKDITRDRLYLEAVESVLSGSTKILIDLDSSNNLLYLPLDRLVIPPPNSLNPSPTDPHSVTGSNERRQSGRNSRASGNRGLIQRERNR